ncbi:MAG: hypothetical protein JWO20_427 [Candidatus Angelobacter sp.]|nr:hypothetical protein [Candidatus Angelobacter sp.]
MSGAPIVYSLSLMCGPPADRKEDPLLWVTPRDFWRTHPEAAKEIVNYHVHEDAEGNDESYQIHLA